MVVRIHDKIGSYHHYTSQTQTVAAGVDDFGIDMSIANNYGGGGRMNDNMYDRMTGPIVTTTAGGTSTAATDNISTAASEKKEALVIPNNPHSSHNALGYSSSTAHPISDHHHHHPAVHCHASPSHVASSVLIYAPVAFPYVINSNGTFPNVTTTWTPLKSISVATSA